MYISKDKHCSPHCKNSTVACFSCEENNDCDCEILPEECYACKSTDGLAFAANLEKYTCFRCYLKFTASSYTVKNPTNPTILTWSDVRRFFVDYAHKNICTEQRCICDTIAN